MSALDELAAELETELDSLSRLRIDYSGLLKKVASQEPTNVELLALSSILQSFYAGVENCLWRVERAFGAESVKSATWHADLLKSAMMPSKHRPAIIDSEIYSSLKQYLGFRHIARTRYSFDLDWGQMRELVVQLPNELTRFATQVRQFIVWLEARSNE